MTNEFEGRLDRIGTKLINLISYEMSKGTNHISTLAQEIFPTSDQVLEFLGMREGDYIYRTEFLPRLIDFLEAIYNTREIKSIKSNDLEFLKNSLLDLCFSHFIRQGLTIETLWKRSISNKIMDQLLNNPIYEEMPNFNVRNTFENLIKIELEQSFVKNIQNPEP